MKNLQEAAASFAQQRVEAVEMRQAKSKDCQDNMALWRQLRDYLAERGQLDLFNKLHCSSMECSLTLACDCYVQGMRDRVFVDQALAADRS